MSKDNGKAYRQVKVSIHELLDEEQRDEENEWTVYMTSFIRHLKQKDGSVKVDPELVTDDNHAESFISAIANVLGSVIVDEYDAQEAFKVAVNIMGHVIRQVGESSGIEFTEIRRPFGTPENAGFEQFLEEDSELTDEQKEALKLSLMNDKLKTGWEN